MDGCKKSLIKNGAIFNPKSPYIDQIVTGNLTNNSVIYYSERDDKFGKASNALFRQDEYFKVDPLNKIITVLDFDLLTKEEDAKIQTAFFEDFLKAIKYPQQASSLMTTEEILKEWNATNTDIPIPIMLYMHAAHTSASEIRGVRRSLLLKAIESTIQAHYKLENSKYSMHEFLNYNMKPMQNSQLCVAEAVQLAVNILQKEKGKKVPSTNAISSWPPIHPEGHVSTNLIITARVLNHDDLDNLDSKVLNLDDLISAEKDGRVLKNFMINTFGKFEITLKRLSFIQSYVTISLSQTLFYYCYC